VYQKGTYANLRQRPLSDIVEQYAAALVWPRTIGMALLQPSELYIEEKQTDLENECK